MKTFYKILGLVAAFILASTVSLGYVLDWVIAITGNPFSTWKITAGMLTLLGWVAIFAIPVSKIIKKELDI
jgi:hypothetical protein